MVYTPSEPAVNNQLDEDLGYFTSMELIGDMIDFF